MSTGRADVVIIGAGILGSSIAYSLAERGVRSVVIDAGRPACGATLASFGYINAIGKRPREYFDLNVAAMMEHRRLRAEMNEDSWFHEGGNLEWTTDSDNVDYDVEDAKRRASELQAWGYAVEFVDATMVRHLEADVAISESASGVFYPDDAWVDPTVLVHRMLASPRIDLWNSAQVVALEYSDGRIKGLTVADGRRLATDLVVFCGGPKSPDLLAMAGLRLPMRRSPGMVALTEPAPVHVRRILHVPGLAVRPDGAGRLMLQSASVDRDLKVASGRAAISSALETIRGRAQSLLPGLNGVGIESYRLGERAMPIDGLPVLGPVPGIAGAYIAVTHSGITLGPLLGRLVASEVIDLRPEEVLEPYRPTRTIESLSSRFGSE